MSRKVDGEFAKHIGQKLRELRLKKGKTLKEVANETEGAHGYLSRIERGMHGITLELLIRLAECYQVPLTEIIPVQETGETKTLNIQKALWSSDILLFEDEVIQITDELRTNVEIALRMGIALTQKNEKGS